MPIRSKNKNRYSKKWKQIREQKVDYPPVTERIKTFEDACLALGDEHPFVEAYNALLFVEAYNALFMERKENTCDLPLWKDLFAYARLRIIVAALNEGWEPKFTEDEYRYLPWFHFYTKEEYDKLDDEKKGRCVLRSGANTHSSFGFVLCCASYVASHSCTSVGSRLVFRTLELAAYAGRQFTEEWVDFMFKPRTGEELNGKSEAAKTTIDFNNNDYE